MSTNVGKKNIAHKGSGHGVVAPAAVSLVSPPAPPAPTPFPYTARSSDAKKTTSKLKVGGKNVLVEGSTMALDPPANQPAQTGGGDVVTHATKNIAVMTTGSMGQTVGGKGVCATGDIAALNVLVEQSKIAQMQSPLLEAGDFDTAGKSNAAAAAMNKKYKRAFPPSKASQCRGGHPVDLGTGYVVDDAIDLELPGFIPLVWSRTYSSSFASHRGALGKGGWTHSFEQWIEETETGYRLHNEEGLPIDFGPVDEDGTSFHRGQRVELKKRDRSFEVRSLRDRLIRTFSPLPNGRCALRSILDSRTHRIELEYQGDLLIRILDSVGREVRLSNDEKGRVTRVEVWASEPGSEKPPELQTWFGYGYHHEGELASHTNALDHMETWEYDGLHRMVRVTLRNGVSFYYEYHPELGYCAHTWGDGGLHNVRLDIDFENNITTTHGTGLGRRYHWKNGIVWREETFDGTWATERIRDEDEILIAVRNGVGEETTYEYDTRGNLIKETDPSGNVLRWEYQDDLPVRHNGPTGLETRYAHDHHGSLIGITFPIGLSYEFQLDREGRLSVLRGLEGIRMKLEYDEHNNIAVETSARGAATRLVHDALGRPIEQIDGIGRMSRAEYDRLGQPLSIVRPDGTRVQATYDQLGNTASTTDALGYVTRLDYVGTGQLARLWHADGQVICFHYDSDERLIEVINQRMERNHFDYDSADRIVAERTFDGQLITYRYDRAGRTTRIDFPENEWREFGHDKLGNVLEDRGPDVQISYVRDALGRVEKAVCHDVTGKVVTEFERDRFGRLTADIQNGRAARYEYDGSGRRSARVLPDGERTDYHYDLDDHFAGVTHDGKRIVIERDRLGRERTRRAPGFQVESEYDEMDRLLSQKAVAPEPGLGVPRTLAQRQHRYDAKGRLTSIDSLHGGLTKYSYDSIDQLVEAVRGGRREVFEYDPTGSLVNILSGLGAVERKPAWSVRIGNQLAATDGAKFINDGRGRRIQKSERADGQREYETITTYGWDTKDRLREIVMPDGQRIRFTYDAFGRRVRKDVRAPQQDLAAMLTGVSGGLHRYTVEFLWDGDVLCEERDSSKEEVARKRIHVHEPGTFVPMLQAEHGQIFVVINDHLGMPKELVDGAGRVAWRATHGAWGDVLDVTRDRGVMEVESPFRLLGQYADEETGLRSTRYRYFDAGTGRWLSTDPLGLGGGPNLLAWGRAPVLTADPLGLSTDMPVLATQPADVPYRNLLVAMSKPSMKEHLLPVDRYVNPGHHDPSGGGPSRYNSTKSVLPKNHVELFINSVPVRDLISGKLTRWTKEGKGKNVVFHRFDGTNGEFHWNGSTRGKTKSGIPRELSINDVPTCMKE